MAEPGSQAVPPAPRTVDALVEALADIDPWRLVAMGAPRDEYAPEARHLLGRGRPITPADVVDTFAYFARGVDADGVAVREEAAPELRVGAEDARRIADAANVLLHAEREADR